MNVINEEIEVGSEDTVLPLIRPKKKSKSKATSEPSQKDLDLIQGANLLMTIASQKEIVHENVSKESAHGQEPTLDLGENQGGTAHMSGEHINV